MGDARDHPTVRANQTNEAAAIERLAPTHSKEKIYRFARHHEVHAYLKLGWNIAEIDIGHHSYYSVLLNWLCNCNPVEPSHE